MGHSGFSNPSAANIANHVASDFDGGGTAGPEADVEKVIEDLRAAANIPASEAREILRRAVSVFGISVPPAPAPRCRVYWGTHGCRFDRGHEGPHICVCCECDDHDATEGLLESGMWCVGAPPYYGDGTQFYGEDAG